MTSADKATPRPWAVEEVWVEELFIVQPDGKGGWFGIAEMSKDGAFADANLIVQAVNSYNPKRDKLARELAEIVELNTTWAIEYRRDIPYDYPKLKRFQDKARQLLKLYKEEK